MIGRTPGNIHGHPADEGRRHRRLRHHRGDAPLLHRQGHEGRIGFSQARRDDQRPGRGHQVEKRAVRDAALKAGAREAYLIEEPLAAAIGANVPICGPSGNMIIDIGGGTSEIAVIALGGIVVSHLAARRRQPVRRVDRHLHPQEVQPHDRRADRRRGQDPDRHGPAARARAADGGPRPRPHRRPAAHDPDHLSEVMEAIELPLQQLVAAVRARARADAARAVSSDIIDKGMVMSGGGALLRNIDKLLTQVTGVPCHVAENALNCVALGTGLALEHFDFFKKSLVQRDLSAVLTTAPPTTASAPRAFVDLHCHTSAQLRLAGRRRRPSSRAAASARPDPSRDHRPRPDRRRAASPRRGDPDGPDGHRRRGDPDAPTATSSALFLERPFRPACRPPRRSRPSASRAASSASRIRSTASAARSASDARRRRSRRSPSRSTGSRPTTRGSIGRRGNERAAELAHASTGCPGSPSPTRTPTHRGRRRVHGPRRRPVDRRRAARRPRRPPSSSPAARPTSCGAHAGRQGSSSGAGNGRITATPIASAPPGATGDERTARSTASRPDASRRTDPRRPPRSPRRLPPSRHEEPPGDVPREQLVASRRAPARSRGRSSRSSCRSSCSSSSSSACRASSSSELPGNILRGEPAAAAGGVRRLLPRLPAARLALVDARCAAPASRSASRDATEIIFISLARQLPRAGQARRRLPRLPAQDQLPGLAERGRSGPSSSSGSSTSSRSWCSASRRGS